ncbi:MAG: secretin and TonB N-terminal domain-containing protein, partial [Pseudomonadota bacterium]
MAFSYRAKDDAAVIHKSLAILTLLACALYSLATSAAERTLPVDMAPQPLSSALLEIGRLFDVSVVVSGDLAAGKEAPPLRGDFGATEAIEKLLLGSGLSAKRASNGAYHIIKQASLSTEQDSSVASSNKLEEIIVIGTRQSRYIVNAIDANSGLDLSFLENPRNVTIIPEQLVLDQKITDLNEALRVVPNYAEGSGFAGTDNDYFLRGFRT